MHRITIQDVAEWALGTVSDSVRLAIQADLDSADSLVLEYLEWKGDVSGRSTPRLVQEHFENISPDLRSALENISFDDYDEDISAPRGHDQADVMVMHVDKEREKSALGLKQNSPSPWEKVEKKYPVATRVIGEVVDYGAFVKLEEGIEGVVPISEMSWTSRNPMSLTRIGDRVEVVVLGIDKDKQALSLSMKRTQVNPWDQTFGKYRPGVMVEGTVHILTDYGAFVILEEGIDGLIHISEMSWTRKIGHPSEILEEDQRISCLVLNVDLTRDRIFLGLKQLKDDPWESDIPSRYEPGNLVGGKVTKLTNIGVFVELEPDLEGLIDISELADHKVENPEEVVKVGDEIEVQILRVDRNERNISLSRKNVH